VSDAGAFDMVGNVWEFTADWVPLSQGDCPGWGDFSNAQMCLAGTDMEGGGPGVIVRGGSIGYSDAASVFAVRGDWTPSRGRLPVGFRAAH
jgi:formylglycine-generating enzyme required for sulfatase activity